MSKATTLVIAVLMVAGFTVLSPSVAAHPDNEHCYVALTVADPDDPNEPGWEDADCDDPNDPLVQRKALISGAYNAPPIEGPGNPDGGGEWGGTDDPTHCEGGCVFPYIFQAVILTQPLPCSFAGEELPEPACVTIRNGGAVFNACDSGAHWLLGGGVSDLDMPCSWDRGSLSGDDTEATVDNARPFDTVRVKFDCVTCFVDRQIPFVTTTNSQDADSFHGEGQGEKPGNNGGCRGSVVGDFAPPTLLTCNDNGAGPREVSINECSSSTSGQFGDEITRPNSAEWGTGVGVYQQALSEESYTTHHLGDDDEQVDNLGQEGGDEVRDHPGVQTVAIFLYGPIHGGQSCSDASPVPTSVGTFTVEVS